jgi:hypothetical protein
LLILAPAPPSKGQSGAVGIGCGVRGQVGVRLMKRHPQWPRNTTRAWICVAIGRGGTTRGVHPVAGGPPTPCCHPTVPSLGTAALSLLEGEHWGRFPRLRRGGGGRPRGGTGHKHKSPPPPPTQNEKTWRKPLKALPRLLAGHPRAPWSPRARTPYKDSFKPTGMDQASRSPCNPDRPAAIDPPTHSETTKVCDFGYDGAGKRGRVRNAE